MYRINRWFTILLLVALLLSACQPIQRVPEPQTAPASKLEVFVKGAPVRLAVGLAVGPDDNLYVSTMWIRSLLVLNPDTGLKTA